MFLLSLYFQPLFSGLQGKGGAGVLQPLAVHGEQRGQELRHGRPAQRRPHSQLHHRRLCGLPLHCGREFLYPAPVSGLPGSRSGGDAARHAIEG